MATEKKHRVFVDICTGSPEHALRFAGERYPGAEVVELSHRQLREGGWRWQLRAIRRLRGCALVFYFDRPEDITQPGLLFAVHFLHRCRETVIVDRGGVVAVHTFWSCATGLPRSLASAALDGVIIAVSYVALRWLRRSIKPEDGEASDREERPADFDLTYLFPFPLNRAMAGGAISHIRGVLGGIAANAGRCEIFTGYPLPYDGFPATLIEAGRSKYMFAEAMMLAYNRHFCSVVRKALRTRKPRTLYQRHGRFVIAGILLSRALRVPLILEYNGSEYWMADFWDPTRFKTWLRLCEEISIFGASRIVVVSEASRRELVARGVAEERIMLNPNAVDPKRFHPGCGGEEVRRQLGFTSKDVVVAFLGTFSYWHGIEVLQKSALQLLGRSSIDPIAARIRFLLIGQGILHADIHAALMSQVEEKRVVFTGMVSHDRVPTYLDASDILVSPHVPMPDGQPFFGSPTKLFEYMAMGKAIVASRLDQLAEVLTHDETALLVTPGDADELAAAILLAASDPALRMRLGSGARQAAMSRHTWAQNAARVLAAFDTADAPVARWSRRGIAKTEATHP